jgi:hypothetical protein
MSHNAKQNTERCIDWMNQRLDEAQVVALRGYASQIWARHPNMSRANIEHAMSEHSQRIGATAREFRLACLNLEFIRDDCEFAAPNRSMTPTATLAACELGEYEMVERR